MFSQEESLAFQKSILQQLNQNPYWIEAKTLIIPETTNSAFLELAQKSGKKIVILYKETKEEIKKTIAVQTMMKTEREKLLASIDGMEIIKMANIAGNQRKRFVECLFKPLHLDNTEKVVFFDDSMFSGYTFQAAQYRLDFPHHNIILFDKNL